jgi:hypothetical protein
VDSSVWIAQIDELTSEAAGLRALSEFDDLSDLGTPIVAVDVRLAAAIQRIAPSSAYATEAHRAVQLESWERVPRYLGILAALRADLESGWVDSLTEVIHAQTFSDVLDQAVELSDKGYKDPAAVIAGAALESHLRLLAVKHGVDTTLPAGGPKKADTLNADLAKAGAYATIQQKSVTAWLGIRNAAAHGDYAKYVGSEVHQTIEAIRDFIARLPA